MNDALSKHRLKMWIQLLGVTRAAEGQLRGFLREKHHTTLPRFDVLAALHRHREGVRMSELSQMLLVSNGNSTTVVDRLEKDGLVQRSTSGTDRRTVLVALTDEGLRQFEGLAADHERELGKLFGGMSESDMTVMTEILKRIGKGKMA